MAYAAVVSLSKIIDDLLHDPFSSKNKNKKTKKKKDLLRDPCTISLPENPQIVSIYEYAIFFQAFLENFPEKANILEERMRDAANKAEDIIENFMSDEIQSSAEFAKHQTELRLHYDFQKLNQVLQEVMEEIDSIAGEVMEIKNRTRTEDVQVQLSEYSSVATSSSGLIAPTTIDGAMVGFEDDLMAIKGRLCGESSKLQVIPIFGMGGIGKTTLARNAYDDPLTVEHFDIRTWVTVSQHYSAKKILSSIVDSVKAEGSRHSNQLMREAVYKRLKGRRYLIVIDDIWSTTVWDDAKKIFPDDYNGSRIILTTRLLDVATYPDSSSPHHEMHLMDAYQSWNLLRQKVFPQENCPPKMETIGREIARSCGGLPLAIVLMAGLLSIVSKTQASWSNIVENINLVISCTNDEHISRILSLSYTHLPHHLRPCFLYMGGLPEDCEIRVSKLIKLWVAEGFLKPSGSKSFEEVAEEYLEDLVKRSLVLVIKMKPNGKIKSCSLHDLVRDLCVSKAQEEKFRLNVLDRYASNVLLESIKNERRIITDDLDCLENIYDSTIRTIICFHPIGSSLGFLRNFSLLRVLDVITSHFTPFYTSELPYEVFKLFHLKYLAFTCGAKFVLPSSILNLQNLQTLIVHPESRYLLLSPLPLEIWRMRQLRHLIFYGPLPDIPRGAPTFALENLQTLLGVITNFKRTKKILKMLPNLKKLGIIYSREKCIKDSYLENLVHLHQLEKLKIEAYIVSSFKGKHNLVFPTTLKKLSLSPRGLSWEDISIVGLLPNLQVLKMRNFYFSGDKWETREGEFCQLKFLLIENSDLRHWITENSHFPCLKCLVLYGCGHLREIPNGIGEIPTLDLIEVDNLNESLLESARRIKEEQQESWGNSALQVRVGHTWSKQIIYF